MNLIVRLLLFAFVLSFRPAFAQEAETGTGLICDTPQQAEQFVRDFTTTDATLAAINKDNPSACGVASVAFIRGAQVSVVRNRQGTFAVTEITVIAGATPAGIRPIPPAVQYTLFTVKEEGA